jgi:antitoxin (DNA-binding transcriptional repressor) of toxin-antitoxin stability system
MTTISVHDIQQDPLGCIRRVEAGETLLVLRDDHAIAEIKPVSGPVPLCRPFGLCAGEFKVPPEFDDPLPEDILHQPVT